MNRALLMLLGLVSVAYAGEGLLGTKTVPGSTTTASAGGIGVMPFVQVGLALAIVFGLVKFVLPKVITRVSKHLTTPVGSAIRIEESAAFAGGTLYLVRARQRELLLSVGPQGVTCLADVTSSPVTQASEPKTFAELVEEAPEYAVAEVGAITADELRTEAGDDVQAALSRLRRFGL